MIAIGSDSRIGVNSALIGDLSVIPLPALLEFLRLNGLSGRLWLEAGDQRMVLDFNAGMLADARPFPAPRRAQDEPVEALARRLLTVAFKWRDGQFVFDKAKLLSKRTPIDVQRLLLELAQAEDEGRAVEALELEEAV